MKCFMSDKDCDCKLEFNKSKVFIISPFEYPYDDLYFKIKETLNDIKIKDVVPECSEDIKSISLNVSRANKALQLGFVMCQRVCKEIQEAEYILADITELNSNVYYELGLSFAMNKKIILISRKELNNSFHLGLVGDNNKNAFIHYEKLEDLTDHNRYISAFKKPIFLNNDFEKSSKPIISNIINSDYLIEGVHEIAIKKAVSKLNENILKSEDQWGISTIAISKNTCVDNIVKDLIKSKVCIIDTTNYDRNVRFPFIYFCLGLGHGLEKEVIPLTLTSRLELLPFDVRGLWHIFYSDSKSLYAQLVEILKNINKSWQREKQNLLYKKIWGPFCKQGETVNIMTCARSISDNKRGDRTNIDKWDYKSVAEISRFLALNFPKSNTNITDPIRKLSSEEIQHDDFQVKKNALKNKLQDKDCIIIGSPDVSDLAEILLSKLHDIDPYKNIRKKSKGFIIIKDISEPSSFIWQNRANESSGISQLAGEGRTSGLYENDLEIMYGILVIANNPFCNNSIDRRIMILSGFSGVATYAIAKLVTDNNFRESLEELFKKIGNEKNENYEILVGANYKEINSTKDGDNREFISIYTTESDKI